MTLENCPKCGQQLTTLQSSGRQICRSCGWTSDNKNEVSEQNQDFKQIETKTSQQKNILLTPISFGRLLFIIGFLTMVWGLSMDTTVCNLEEFSQNCTHNLGLLNSRSNVVNAGGFTAVCGAILSSNSARKK